MQQDFTIINIILEAPELSVWLKSGLDDPRNEKRLYDTATKPLRTEWGKELSVADGKF